MRALRPSLARVEVAAGRLRASRRWAGSVMWAALASVGLAVVATVAAWASPRWVALAAGVLVLVCLGTCVWSAVAGNRLHRQTESLLSDLHRRLVEGRPGGPGDRGCLT